MIGRLLRTSALLSALATAMMPGMLAVAEGAIEAAATAAATAHIEVAGGSASCPVAHDAHCAACSMLRHGYTGPAHAVAPRVIATGADGAPRRITLAVESRFQSAGSPRAPPAA